MKFVLTQPLCAEGMERLAQKAEINIAGNPDPHTYRDLLADTDAIIVRIASFRKDDIEASPNLKVIGRTGVGYDSVDVSDATARGIPVVITPGANSRSVAEHTVAMMLAISKNLILCHTETLAGNFATVRDAQRNRELCGCVAGIVGLGAIGSIVAKLCMTFGMRVVAYDPQKTPGQIVQAGCEYVETLEDLLRQSDFVTLHCPLDDSTRNLIGKEKLGLMKPTASLINCARGGIVDEQALADALNNGRIFAAATDVFASEPPAADSPLLSAKRLIVSPHNAAQTDSAVVNMAFSCIDGCLAVLAGERWPHVADPKVYEHPRWKRDKALC